MKSDIQKFISIAKTLDILKKVSASAKKDALPTDPAPDEYVAYWRDYDALQRELGSTWLADYLSRAYGVLEDRIDGQPLQDHVLGEALSAYRDDLAATWVGTAEQPGPLTRLVLAGMTAANESVRRNVTTNPIKAIAVGVDWQLLAQQALNFARGYAYDLIRGLDDTTREQVRSAVTAWLESGAPLDDLKKSIEAIFHDPVRAELIASTESARAYNAGAVDRWASLDIQRATLHTQHDSTVCPICSPHNGVTADIATGWQNDKGGYSVPPIHPGCRCYMRPVVD